MILRVATFLIGLTVAGAVHADPTFDAFQALCVKPVAEPATVMQAAEAANWQPIPDAIKQQMAATLKLQGIEGRMRSDNSGLSFVVVGAQGLPVEGRTIDVRLCVVATTAAGSDGRAAALAAWAAVPQNAMLSKQGGQAYAFSDEPAGHKVIESPTDATALALIKSGRVRFAIAFGNPKLSMLALAVPTI